MKVFVFLTLLPQITQYLRSCGAWREGITDPGTLRIIAEFTRDEVGHLGDEGGVDQEFLEVSVRGCMGEDYEVLILERDCKGRECVVRGTVVDIVDLWWELIGAGEQSNGVVRWRGVVLVAGFEGGSSVRESAEDSR